MKKVEILSPAGSYESLMAAIAAGADAVYIGGTKFGARAYADNLDEETMLKVIDYVHLHGRRIYLTVNTLLKEQEIQRELYEYLLPYYRCGIDAVIVQDMGVLKFVKEHFPDLPIHASTQMTITDLLGAKFLEKQGVERIVTSREMCLDEIREISENTDVEIESFVHGALCYCYSGQCLYSSMIGGRSGNRGQCAQPCRLPYKVQGERDAKYIMSLKDICTLEYIPELVEAGIFSFKIEGRMKKPEYVALVTAMYRKYVDLYLEKGKAAFKVDPKDKEKLMDLYNRGGSHGGYYHTQNGREMISLERPNHAGVSVLEVLSYNGKTVTAKAISDIHAGDVIELPDGKENFTFANEIKKGQRFSFPTHKKQIFQKNAVLNRVRNESLLREIQDTIIQRKIKEKINGKLILSEGTSAKLLLYYGNILVEVNGAVPQEAMNQPMDASRIEKQMRKTGNTEFEFETFEVELSGRLFMPMQSLNELRRLGIEALEEKILSSYRRTNEQEDVLYSQEEEPHCKTVGFRVYVEELEQFETVLENACVKRIYLDSNAIDRIWENTDTDCIIAKAHEYGKEVYLAMPHIFRSKTRKKYEEFYTTLEKQEWDGVLVRNCESYEFLLEHGFRGNIVTDYSIYQFNTYAKQFWQEEQVESFTAPLELNYRELKDVGLQNSELVVYGYFPMMVSAQCITKTTKGCRKEKGRLTFTDRYQKEFTVKNHCDYCYNVIYNTAPVMLLDQKTEIMDLNPKGLKLHFTIENPTEVRRILYMYERVFLQGDSGLEPGIEFTRGHFKRGIK